MAENSDHLVNSALSFLKPCSRRDSEKQANAQDLMSETSMRKDAPRLVKKSRILILGGGFGGFYTAHYLDKTLAADPTVEVALVSRENFLLFTPMLHEVAAGDLEVSDIVSPPRQILKHVVCLEAEVERIDLDERRVTLAYGVFRREKELFYDHLVIALGSETNFFKLPGVEERALTMKSLGDAFYLRNHALALLEIASLTEDEAARRAMLTFVVAGGGFAGNGNRRRVNRLFTRREKVLPSPRKRQRARRSRSSRSSYTAGARRKPRTIRARETRCAEGRDSTGDACGPLIQTEAWN